MPRRVVNRAVHKSAQSVARHRAATASAAAYGEDLAHIHDAGFGNFAQHAGQWLVETLEDRHSNALVVDLGCGSGILAEILTGAGHLVLGVDISEGMLALARRRVPTAEFRQGSFLQADLPPCHVVTAIGEILNYLFDEANTPQALQRFFRRVHDALLPGGLFVCDVALVGRVAEGTRRGYTEGDGWACLFEATEDAQRRELTRRITTFRRVGDTYRRDTEVHRLRLFQRAELTASLRKAGFKVRTQRSYGELKFPPGYVGIVARKA